MPRLAGYVSIALMSLALAGCMSCGVPADAEQLQSFKIGSTTAPEVQAMLGQPSESSTNGQEVTLAYEYTYNDSKWENFIPIAGGVAGGFDKKIQTDVFVFDAEGRLKSYNQTSSVNGVETPPIVYPD